MERPIPKDYKEDSIYNNLKLFDREKYIEDLSKYCDKLESSYNKLLEQCKNKDKLSSNDLFIKLRAIAKEFGKEYLWYIDEIIQEFNK